MARPTSAIAETLQAGLESMDMSSVVRPEATRLELVNRRFFIGEMTGNSGGNNLKMGDQVLVCPADRKSYFVMRRDVVAIGKSRCQVISEVSLQDGIQRLKLDGVRFDFDAVLKLAARNCIFDKAAAAGYSTLGVQSDACSVLSEVARLRLEPDACDLSSESPLVQASVAAGALSESERHSLELRWPVWLSMQREKADDKSNANWIRHGFSLSDPAEATQYAFKKKGGTVFVVTDPSRSDHLPQFNANLLVSIYSEKNQAYADDQRTASGIENLNQLITQWARELTSRVGKVPGMR